MRSIRQPGQLAFALVFPLFFFTVIASGLDRASALPGFPADSYVDFMFAIPFVHGALFTSLNSAIELGRDIDTGFLNRLALTPARGVAIMLGNLAGGVALVHDPVHCIYFVGGLAAGRRTSTPARSGSPCCSLLAAIGAVAIGAVGMTVALRTRLARGRAGHLPALLRRAVPLVDEHAAQPDRDRLVPLDRDR